jgi:hypothetical protein
MIAVFIVRTARLAAVSGQIPTPASDGAGYRLRGAADAVSSLSIRVAMSMGKAPLVTPFGSAFLSSRSRSLCSSRSTIFG